MHNFIWRKTTNSLTTCIWIYRIYRKRRYNQCYLVVSTKVISYNCLISKTINDDMGLLSSTTALSVPQLPHVSVSVIPVFYSYWRHWLRSRTTAVLFDPRTNLSAEGMISSSSSYIISWWYLFNSPRIWTTPFLLTSTTTDVKITCLVEPMKVRQSVNSTVIQRIGIFLLIVKMLWNYRTDFI